jgi:membrane fusion protein, multidrug efflux system
VESETDRDGKSGRFLLLGWIIAILCVLIASVGLVFARQGLIARQTGELEQEQARGPRVLVVPLSQAGGTKSIDIPASIHGYIETPVYAKVAGYMKTIRVDKGDQVKKGEVIAFIESPETDKAVSDALANYRLQLVTDRRDEYLLQNQVISQQAEDTQHAAMLQAKATYEQQLALQQYETVTSPFDGIITARYVDPGTLIPQSTAPSNGNPIVAMATLSPLRVYANVPQTLAPFVRDGDAAEVSVTEYPGRKFTGTVTRHPEALDQNTRTMLVEVDLLNLDKMLLPGMYADTRLNIYASVGAILAPDDALIYRNDKAYLPLVRGNHITLAEVALSHDDGYRVQVTGDVRAGDLVAMNVGQAARDGELVQPVRQRGQ